MTLTLRELNNAGAPLCAPDGTPLEGISITFTLVTASGRPTDAWDGISSERMSIGPQTVTTDAAGEFTVDLWPNSRGRQATMYLCHVEAPGFRDFRAAIDAGVDALSWSDFMLAGEASTPVGLSALQAHVQKTSGAHAASAISVSTISGRIATTVQAMLAELSAAIASGGGGGGGSNDRANHTGTQLAATISDFAATVRSTVLTGLATTAATTVTAAHTVLQAIGFLQKQSTDNATAISSHVADAANPHGVTKAQVGLSNADNTSDANKPVSTAQAAADAAVLTSAQSYADSLVVGLVDDRGNFDASGNAFPTTGGSGAGGAILKGDLWTISVAGTLGGHPVTAGDLLRALVDSPGSTDANWAITENNIGYVAENASNKNASGGYAGLTLFKLDLMNALGTVKSWFTTAATTARTWAMPDKSGTVALLDDITGTNSGTNTGDETGARVATLLHAATAKSAIVDADEVGSTDSAASFGLIRTLWSDVRTYLASKAWTWLAAHIFSDQIVSRAMLKDCGQAYTDKGNSGTSTQTLDYTEGSHQKITATGNFTIATSNWPPSGNTGAILLEAVNFGAFTVTWPTITWVKPDGTTTTSISTWLAASTGRTAFQTSGTDFIKLVSRDAGTTIYGSWAL